MGDWPTHDPTRLEKCQSYGGIGVGIGISAVLDQPSEVRSLNGYDEENNLYFLALRG